MKARSLERGEVIGGMNSGSPEVEVHDGGKEERDGCGELVIKREFLNSKGKGHAFPSISSSLHLLRLVWSCVATHFFAF